MLGIDATGWLEVSQPVSAKRVSSAWLGLTSRTVAGDVLSQG